MIAFSELPDKDRANIIAKAVRNGARSLDDVQESFSIVQDEIDFLKQRLQLPKNLLEDTHLYNLRGALKAGLTPEYDPKDKKYHLGSRNPSTGEIFKSVAHSTYPAALLEDMRLGYYPNRLGTHTNTWEGLDWINTILHRYDTGGSVSKKSFRPSPQIKKQISTWEGRSMTGAIDPITHKWERNNSFEKEAKGFYNALPSSIRDRVLDNQSLADYLFSYSYNVGSTNFKKRVVPILEAYYRGEASVPDIQRAMWASHDKDLRGLRTRRHAERAGVGEALGYTGEEALDFIKGVDEDVPVSKNALHASSVLNNMFSLATHYAEGEKLKARNFVLSNYEARSLKPQKKETIPYLAEDEEEEDEEDFEALNDYLDEQELEDMYYEDDDYSQLPQYQYTAGQYDVEPYQFPELRPTFSQEDLRMPTMSLDYLEEDDFNPSDYLENPYQQILTPQQPQQQKNPYEDYEYYEPIDIVTPLGNRLSYLNKNNILAFGGHLFAPGGDLSDIVINSAIVGDPSASAAAGWQTSPSGTPSQDINRPGAEQLRDNLSTLSSALDVVGPGGLIESLPGIANWIRKGKLVKGLINQGKLATKLLTKGSKSHPIELKPVTIKAENAASITPKKTTVRLKNANSVAEHPKFDFFNLEDTPENAVANIMAEIQLEQQAANIGLFNRLFNKNKVSQANQAKLKIEKLNLDLKVAELRVKAASEEKSTDFMRERLNNYTNEELENMGIDGNKNIPVYTSMLDFMNKTKTLLGHENDLVQLKDAVQKYSKIELLLKNKALPKTEIETLQKLQDAAMLDVDKIAENLGKLGFDDSELNTFASLIYNEADKTFNLGDAFALRDEGLIVAPNPLDAGYNIVVNHEKNHILQNAAKAFSNFVKKFGNNTGFKLSGEYLNKLTEQLARGTQIKDFFGLKGNLDITPDMLKYAAKHYRNLTHLNNNMSEFFNGITDYEKAAKWLSYAASLGIPMDVALNYTSENNSKLKGN